MQLLQYLRKYFDVFRVKLVYFRTYYYEICIMLGFLGIISISVIFMVGVFVHTAYLIIPVLVSIYVCANLLFMKLVLRTH